jgi:hypothetical protein
VQAALVRLALVLQRALQMAAPAQRVLATVPPRPPA